MSHQSKAADHTLFDGGPGDRRVRTRILVIGGLTMAAIMIVALLGRIPQNEGYHDFADQRRILGVPNFLNVVSNIPFLFSGILGLVFVVRNGKPGSKTFVHRSERWPYLLFFPGVILTSFGSAYYHLAPATGRLMWDRLPMSIAFMALLASVVGERINARAGLLLLVPLLAIGVGSVVSWNLSEANGHGDLRLYILVQFYSLVAVVLIAAMFSSRYSHSKELVGALICYVLAKTLELLDRPILSVGRIVSGHTMKHLSAAFAAYLIVHMLKQRMPRPARSIVEQPAAV